MRTQPDMCLCEGITAHPHLGNTIGTTCCETAAEGFRWQVNRRWLTTDRHRLDGNCRVVGWCSVQSQAYWSPTLLFWH